MAVIEALGRVPRQTYSIGERNPGWVKGAAVLGLAAANHYGGELVWKSGPNEVFLHPYDGPPKRTATLIAPGFGSLNGHLMAQDLAKTPFGKQQMLYCQYDNKKGANNETLARQLVNWQQQLGFEGIDVYAPSMGFIHALEIAKLSGIPLRNVLTTGSPSHLRDARAGQFGFMVAKYFPYDGGLGAKFTSTLVANTARYGLGQTPNNFTNAVGETFRGASTKLLRTQIKMLGTKDIHTNWADYKDVIIPGYTQFAYAASRDASDKVVFTEQAYRGVEQFAGNFQNGDVNVPVTFIQLPDGAGHANTLITLGAARPWMENLEANAVGERILYQKLA